MTLPFAGWAERVRPTAPARGFATAIVTLMCVLSAPASAQPKGKTDPAPKASAVKPADRPDRKPAAPSSPKEKTFDFNSLQLNGQLRTPQLLYFLERANEELERASLEKRSFIPHMVRSVEDEPL